MREKLTVANVRTAAIFIVVLAAYTIQTELAQYVQKSGGYTKPVFLLWLTHSAYLIILPLHLLALQFSKSHSIPESFLVVREIAIAHFEPQTRGDPDFSPSSSRLPRAKLTGAPRWAQRMGLTSLLLACLIAAPALPWYLAVPLTSMADLTAIYNTFAFWAYLLAVRFLGETPTRKKLGSILLALAGVFVIAYGDSFLTGRHEDDPNARTPGQRLIGNLLGFMGSVFYAIYEVWYKQKVSIDEPLPEDTRKLSTFNRTTSHVDNEAYFSGAGNGYAAAPSSDVIYDVEAAVEPALHERDALLDGGQAATASPRPRSPVNKSPNQQTFPPPRSSGTPPPGGDMADEEEQMPRSPSPEWEPARAPDTNTFLLYSNVVTTLIGFFTLTVLWLPLPVLHWTGLETFELPPTRLLLPIAGVMVNGVLFNAGFMVLLSLWGPVIASVGNLCTLVLVAIVDFLVGASSLTIWSVLGSAMIATSFAMLNFSR